MAELKTARGRVGRIQTWLARRRKTRLGPWGEWVALRYLQHLGWDIVARNWTGGRGELDLIAYDGTTLVFAEVKTRRTPSALPPEYGVGEEKKDQIERLAYRFIYRHELDEPPLRFDLIAIETPDRRSFEIRHYLGFM
jgi:putative endonuclease